MAMLVDNSALTKANTDILEASKTFKEKASTFIATLTTTLGTFEGDTKDALMENKIGKSGSETEGTLAYFLEKQIPDLLEGLAKLIEANRTTIDESDKKLADAIKGNGKD